MSSYTHPTRVLRMLPNDFVKSDASKRNIVFTLGAPKVILIKIHSKVDLGLPKAVGLTDEEKKRKAADERAVAAKYGIDCEAYRDLSNKTHNGMHLVENASRVRLDALVVDLATAGYKLTRAVWFQEPAKHGKYAPDPTHQLTFSLEGEAIEMTPTVKAFLDTVYVDGMHLWCNPKMTADGTPWRLDTLNGFYDRARHPADMIAEPGVRLFYDPMHPKNGGYSSDEP